ncbi:MAG: hypothetical protein JWM36_2631 [Hyphomicrobiales bacterium]|jgi:hypothetical protein|nr:hypothetical protein [Hyphomicrobiales bacterium]
MSTSHASLLKDLVPEFVEERVRQHPKKSFDIDEASRALAAMVAETGEKVSFSASDISKIATLLEGHPFLVRLSGARPSWKPGLDRAQINGKS